MVSIYNNLATFGRWQMRVQSIILFVLAVGLIVAGLYFMVKKTENSEQKRTKGIMGAIMFGSAMLAVLLGWLLLYQAKQNNPASRLLAASSAVSFFNPFT
jgi:hypothetical protein